MRDSCYSAPIYMMRKNKIINLNLVIHRNAALKSELKTHQIRNSLKCFLLSFFAKTDLFMNVFFNHPPWRTFLRIYFRSVLFRCPLPNIYIRLVFYFFTSLLLSQTLWTNLPVPALFVSLFS